MKIDFIQFPHVYTETGERILISDCVQQPRIGDRLEYDKEIQLYKVCRQGDSSDCVSGVCQIK